MSVGWSFKKKDVEDEIALFPQESWNLQGATPVAWRAAMLQRFREICKKLGKEGRRQKMVSWFTKIFGDEVYDDQQPGHQECQNEGEE